MPLDGCDQCGRDDCRHCADISPAWAGDRGLFAGAEFLFIRPHFSEAIAFAQGRQTATTFDTSGRELQFDYEGSVRAFLAYRLDRGEGEFRLTYWHFSGDTSADGTAPNPGDFIVDPFGNLVGAMMVIDPSDARFGTLLVGGDRIQTKAVVEMNVFDLDFRKSMLLENPNWALNWAAGVRIADIDQFYESIVSSSGSFFAGGDFSVEFIGAGPHLAFEAQRHLDRDGRFSLFVKTQGALLVGDYNVNSSTTATAPMSFRTSQEESLTRTIPVLETELGLSCNLTDRLTLSAGWLFQAWFDLGTSGGTFGGFFAGADDSNTMSFDGLFVRGELSF